MLIPPASSISSIQPTPYGESLSIKPTGSTKKTEDASFTKLITNMVEEANATHVEADNKVQELIAGNVDNVHDVVLNVAKADLSFRFLMEVRNKVTEAYQEISRMPL